MTSHEPATPQSTSSENEIIDSLITLARSREDVRTFWKHYLNLFVTLCNAKEALLLVEVQQKWQIGQYTDKRPELWPHESIQTQLAETASKNRLATARFNQQQILAIRLDVGAQESPPVLIVNLGSEAKLPQKSTLHCVAALPAIFQTGRQYQQARLDVVFFAEILQMVGAIAEDDKFKLAVLRLTNEVNSLFNCSQVSLGWQKSGHVRLQAMSNLESFDDRTKSVWELEAAMEEAVIQEAEIIWPSAGKSILLRAHHTYGATKRIGNLLTLPIRQKEEIVGALTCEREESHFTEQEIWRLRLLLELCTPWLVKLEDQSLSIINKLRRRIRSSGTSLLGPEQTGTKLLFLALLGIVALMFIPKWPHSIIGTFLLKAENAVFVASPIDGFIKSALVRPGDIVSSGAVMIELDSEELLMEEASALARLARHKREAEKAAAAHSLADMRIAELKAQETQKEIDIISFRLQHTKITAPFDGIVAKGDLQARIGAPIHKGEPFMTIASLKSFYLEIQIDEAELRLVDLNAPTTVTFVGKPQVHFNAKLEAIAPQAQVTGTMNSFIIRAKADNEPLSWWRPGMSGMARIETEKRTLWWKLTHRLIDYLRLKFWL